MVKLARNIDDPTILCRMSPQKHDKIIAGKTAIKKAEYERKALQKQSRDKFLESNFLEFWYKDQDLEKLSIAPMVKSRISKVSKGKGVYFSFDNNHPLGKASFIEHERLHKASFYVTTGFCFNGEQQPFITLFSEVGLIDSTKKDWDRKDSKALFFINQVTTCDTNYTLKTSSIKSIGGFCYNLVKRLNESRNWGLESSGIKSLAKQASLFIESADAIIDRAADAVFDEIKSHHNITTERPRNCFSFTNTRDFRISQQLEVNNQ